MALWSQAWVPPGKGNGARMQLATPGGSGDDRHRSTAAADLQEKLCHWTPSPSAMMLAL